MAMSISVADAKTGHQDVGGQTRPRGSSGRVPDGLGHADARRTAATSWTRTMWRARDDRHHARRQRALPAGRPAARSSRRAPMKLFREGPTRMAGPIDRKTSSRLSRVRL